MKHIIIRIPEHESANCRMVVWYDEDEIVHQIELWSYNTHVASYFNRTCYSFDNLVHDKDTIEVYWGWSATTAKHISWFKKYVGQKYYLSKWGNCWKGDCSKAQTLKATVYNPVRLVLCDE